MFFEPRVYKTKDQTKVSPEFIIGNNDIMVRGGKFYAFWREDLGIWDTDERNLPKYIDHELYRYADMLAEPAQVMTCASFQTKTWETFQRYISNSPDNWVPLDSKVHFLGTDLHKEDYASKTVPYSLSDDPCPNYEKLISTLYNAVDRERLEWAIGCALSGHNLDIQKMFVIYGEPGSGKSTVLEIIAKLFEGYSRQVDVTKMVKSNSSFPLDALSSNPVVGIQPEVDLSRVQVNEVLNSIVAHDTVTIEQKYKTPFDMRIQTILFLATNKLVQITDAWSGMVRRLVVIEPSGRRLPRDEYESVRTGLQYELGSIAKHCMDVYERLGRSYLDAHVAQDMIDKTDYFYAFVMDNLEYFRDQEYVTGAGAYKLYRSYGEENGYRYLDDAMRFRIELGKYFESYKADTTINNVRIRHVFKGFIEEKSMIESRGNDVAIDLREQHSLLDDILADCPAQLATEDGIPSYAWDNVTTTLKDIDTSKVHYVRLPIEHIVIDFDLKDANGEKSLERNLAAASSFPATYAEVSKSGSGLHLHYIYRGDPTKLSSIYSEGIEVKVFKGKSSLRRCLTLCNDTPIAVISSGLPLKGEAPVIDKNHVMKERQIRALILRALRKEIHANTKPNIDFIAKILDEAYYSTEPYDVSDLQSSVIYFAASSTNNSAYCLEKVSAMHFKSDDMLPKSKQEETDIQEKDLVFFDCEVFPNVLIVCWKQKGNPKVYSVYNPGTAFLETFFKSPLVGFNNLRYDNIILYARYIGYDNRALYDLSQDIVARKKMTGFREASGISYTDVYDFASAPHKQSLKKWEIELGIHHQENEYPWDEPVPEEKWPEVAEYCSNDVRATEAVFDHIHSDFVARKILAIMANGTPNDTTNQLTTKLIFQGDNHPQDKLVYTDLSEMFPGYKYEAGKSTYRGHEVGEGGFVYAEPGYYKNVVCIDVASMHPTSIEQLNYLGPYTKRYSQLKQARLAIKHKDMTLLRDIVGGAVMAYIEAQKLNVKDLSNALKTALNSVYGLTAAHFDNPFRHPDNIDNIVAKRGALFMIDLLEACHERGIQVIHIKTDSIKILADPEDEQFVTDFGARYGYEFEIEDRYPKLCLVNKAVYIAQEMNESWTATGAQFAHPYVFKTLFSHEPLTLKDYAETKSVQTALYLAAGEGDKKTYEFVGRVGSFLPVLDSMGRELVAKRDDKYVSVSGAKDYRWILTEWGGFSNSINLDMSYYDKLVDEAKATIEQFVPFEEFVAKDLPF